MAVSTIQNDLEIYGNVQSQGDVVISGSVKGNVAAKAVDVKDSGLVAGNITSEELLTEGKIKGKIKATSVNLKLTSSTDTHMVSNTLVVETGALFLRQAYYSCLLYTSPSPRD